jgi:hypothetical protein
MQHIDQNGRSLAGCDKLVLAIAIKKYKGYSEHAGIMGMPGGLGGANAVPVSPREPGAASWAALGLAARDWSRDDESIYGKELALSIREYTMGRLPW